MAELTANRSERHAEDPNRNTASYACLGPRPSKVPPYQLESLRQPDIQLIRAWRNAQLDVLRQRSVISPAEQQRYFDRVVRPGFAMRHPGMILMSLLREGNCIGYTGLTHIDWSAGRAEISFLVDPVRAASAETYQEDFSRCLEMLARVAFENLGFNRLFAETFDLRPAHVGILESAGYRLEGRLREHVRIAGRLTDSLVHGLLRSEWESNLGS